MTEKIFDVEISVTRRVRVRVPDDVVYKNRGETFADAAFAAAAEEFAIGGKSGWPEYVISEDENYEIESVRAVPDAVTPQ